MKIIAILDEKELKPEILEVTYEASNSQILVTWKQIK